MGKEHVDDGHAERNHRSANASRECDQVSQHHVVRKTFSVHKVDDALESDANVKSLVHIGHQVWDEPSTDPG